MKKILFRQKEITMHDGHKLPVTRRDFLRYGVIPFAANILVPNLVTQLLLKSSALAAAECGKDAGSGYMPFLVFDMAGGAALPGNFLVGKNGGSKTTELIKDYETLGWNPRASGAIDKSYGVPMAANNVSRILTGINATASLQARANLRMGTICHFSLDDTTSNRVSALSLVARAGLRGKFVSSGVGTSNSLSGGNSDVALQDNTLKPIFVSHSNDIKNSVSHGSAFNDFSETQIKTLSEAINEMSLSQLTQFMSLSQATQLEALVECGYKSTLAYGKTIEGLDAGKDRDASGLYQINGGGADQNSIFGSVAHNVISGNTGPGAIVIGDCDYHDSNNIKGDQRDEQMGRQIGLAVELAFRRKTPLFFQLITDGGCSSAPGTRNWTSDSNQRGLTVIGYFNPNKAPEQKRTQVGEYTDGGVVNQNTLIGDEPPKVANAVLANYLSACGKLGEFEKVGQIPFRGDRLESLLIF